MIKDFVKAIIAFMALMISIIVLYLITETIFS